MILEISLREIRPCLRKARIISTSAELTKMGACSRDIFFVPERLLADKVYTTDSIGMGRLEDLADCIHYSDLHL